MLKLLGEETDAFTAVFNNDEQEFTPEYLQHHLNGIQFALGDLEVDTTSLPMQ